MLSYNVGWYISPMELGLFNYYGMVFEDFKTRPAKGRGRDKYGVSHDEEENIIE